MNIFSFPAFIVLFAVWILTVPFILIFVPTSAKNYHNILTGKYFDFVIENKFTNFLMTLTGALVWVYSIYFFIETNEGQKLLTNFFQKLLK